MGYHDSQFPTDISYGSQGGPGFATFIQSTDSGAEERIQRWQSARHQYDVSYGVRTYTQLLALKTFYMARSGAAHSFRYKDFSDCTSLGQATEIGGATPTKDDIEIGVGDDVETQFQIIKKYTNAPTTRTRNITKPVEGTVLVAVDGVLQTETTHYTIDYATGIITFVTAPPLDDSVTVGYEFDVECRFGEGADDLLSINIETFEVGGISSSVPIVEVIDVGETADEFFYGGAKDHGSISTDQQIAFSNGKIQVWNPTVGSLELAMPEINDDMATGGPHVYVYNKNGTNAIDLTTFGGTLIVSIAIGVTVAVLLSRDATDVPTWHAV